MVESTKTGSEEFGDAVRRARERRGMSRRDLAETTGLSYPYISQIETGYRMPSTPAMRSLADALGLRPDRLFDAIPPVAGRDAAMAHPADAEPAMPLSDAPIPAAPRFAPPAAAAPTTSRSSPVAPSAAAPRGGPAAPAAPAGSSPGRPPGARGAAAARGAARPEVAGSSASPLDGAVQTQSIGGASADSSAAGASTDAATLGGRMDSTPVGPQTGSDAIAGLTDFAADAVGGWTPNLGFRPAVARAAAAPGRTGHREQAVDRAAALLTALPTEDRLPALTEVQSRVVRSVVDDEVRRDGVR